MAKRESRQKSRQSVAIRSTKKAAKGDRDTDRDTLRRVREWAERRCARGKRFGWGNTDWECALEVLAILNGTERKETKR